MEYPWFELQEDSADITQGDIIKDCPVPILKEFDISEESRLPSIVTAFSIDALVTYLAYLYQHTRTFNKEDKITETTVPHFWRWSKKFMNVQYVTIHKQMNL